MNSKQNCYESAENEDSNIEATMISRCLRFDLQENSMPSRDPRSQLGESQFPSLKVWGMPSDSMGAMGAMGAMNNMGAAMNPMGGAPMSGPTDPMDLMGGMGPMGPMTNFLDGLGSPVKFSWANLWHPKKLIYWVRKISHALILNFPPLFHSMHSFSCAFLIWLEFYSIEPNCTDSLDIWT